MSFLKVICELQVKQKQVTESDAASKYRSLTTDVCDRTLNFEIFII